MYYVSIMYLNRFNNAFADLIACLDPQTCITHLCRFDAQNRVDTIEFNIGVLYMHHTYKWMQKIQMKTGAIES